MKVGFINLLVFLINRRKKNILQIVNDLQSPILNTEREEANLIRSTNNPFEHIVSSCENVFIWFIFLLFYMICHQIMLYDLYNCFI